MANKQMRERGSQAVFFLQKLVACLSFLSSHREKSMICQVGLDSSMTASSVVFLCVCNYIRYIYIYIIYVTIRVNLAIKLPEYLLLPLLLSASRFESAAP